MTDVTRILAEFSAGIDWAGLPPEVQERTRFLLLDLVGNMVRGRHDAESTAPLLAAARALGFEGGSHGVFGDAGGWTAAALAEEQKRRLSGTARGVLLGTSVLWVIMAAVVVLFQQPILERWKINNPAALWLTLALGLGTLWAPVFGGLLQGLQNFLWVGWSAILNGCGRFTAVTIIVLVFHGHATGIIFGAVLGTAVALGISAWHTRHVWLGAAARPDWVPWLGRVVPLTVGYGAFQFMFSADPLFVQSFFDENQTPPYMAAGTLARALVMFTGPVAAVMFPKIVRSVARAEKTNVLTLTLATVAGLAGLGALGLSLIAPWLLPLFFKNTFTAAIPLLPWFAWSMVPLTVANVLLNNLLARERFHVVWWLAAVAAGYGLALNQFHDSFFTVIRVLGVANLTFLTVLFWFTWRTRNEVAPGSSVAV